MKSYKNRNEFGLRRIIPKNIKVRVFIFAFITLIHLCLFFLTIIYDMWALLIIEVPCFSSPYYLLYAAHVDRYPLNDYSEYQFDPCKDQINKINDVFVIEIEKNLNIYTAKLRDKTLVFDMRGCFYPLTVIKAYLGRQFIMKCIEKFRLDHRAIKVNLNISFVFKKYKNVEIIFKNGNKIKKSYLIKNHKTNMNSSLVINGDPFDIFDERSPKILCYRVITEEVFIARKNFWTNGGKNQK